MSINEEKNLGRNDPCYCGSGKKYKHCCLNKREKIWGDDEENEYRAEMLTKEEQNPTMEELKELYAQAIEFKEGKLWEHFWDADIICVENPDDGEIGYCSIMGRAGEHFAIGVYIGNAGFASFNEAMEIDYESIHPAEVQQIQECIMCSFDDREFVNDEEKKIIKELGLSFRGRKAWPNFQKHEPGYEPWRFNQYECKFMTYILKKILEVAPKIITNEIKTNFEEGQTVLIKPKKIESKELIPIRKYYSEVSINNDILIEDMNRRPKTDLVIQTDVMYTFAMIKKNKRERGYFPRFAVSVDKKTGMALEYKLYKGEEEDANTVIHMIIEIVNKIGRPKEIEIRNERMKYIIGDLCRRTGIKIVNVKKMNLVDRIVEEMSRRY